MPERSSSPLQGPSTEKSPSPSCPSARTLPASRYLRTASRSWPALSISMRTGQCTDSAAPPSPWPTSTDPDRIHMEKRESSPSSLDASSPVEPAWCTAAENKPETLSSWVTSPTHSSGQVTLSTGGSSISAPPSKLQSMSCTGQCPRWLKAQSNPNVRTKGRARS